MERPVQGVRWLGKLGRRAPGKTVHASAGPGDHKFVGLRGRRGPTHRFGWRALSGALGTDERRVRSEAIGW